MNSKGLHIALWIVQVLVGFAFAAIGAMKLGMSVEEMVKNGATWAAETPWLIRFIGASEVAGGLGLILPAASRITPILTPIAAASLTLVMVLALGFHLVFERTLANAVPAIVLGALCAFVAWGRFKKAPIAAR